MAGLSDYLTSDYISKTRHYALDRTREIVMVYVEGNDDIHFWQCALEAWGSTEKYRFNVVTNKMTAENPDAPNGKAVLLRMEHLGKNKILCVDADWDLLVDEYSDCTEQVRNGEFVINTTYYSLENILFSPEYHVSLMHTLGPDEVRQKYEELLIWISNLCNDLFLLMLSYAQQETSERAFGFDDFGKCLNEVKNTDLNSEEAKPGYIRKWKTENDSLFRSQETLMNEAQSSLRDRGYTQNDLWKLMRGHNLYASIIRPWVKGQYDLWKSERIKRYKEEHGAEDIDTFIRSLNSSLGDHRTVYEAIDFYFYNNFPESSWVPDGTRTKIESLFV